MYVFDALDQNGLCCHRIIVDRTNRVTLARSLSVI